MKLDLNLINLILRIEHSKNLIPFMFAKPWILALPWYTLNSESEVDRYDKPYEITQLVTCQVKHAAFIKSSIDVSPSGLKMP